MKTPGGDDAETLTHRLVLPRDANHHGTLYAGRLLTIALEAGYAAAYRAVGESANLVLRRVLDVRCFEPVAVGKVIEIRGREVQRARTNLVVALVGAPLPGRARPWMDSLLQFVQIDDRGRPAPFHAVDPIASEGPLADPWPRYQERARRLLAVRD